MIKHISFDLWLTLIKSHPLFKQKRAELIADLYNPKGLSPQEVLSCITSVDRACNRFNEMNGCKIPSKTMYWKVLLKIGNKEDIITPESVSVMELQIDQLVREYPPELLNQDIPDMLDELKREGKTLNLSSNTGFLESDHLIPILKQMNLYHYFDFCVFSDVINTSKPSPIFFNEIEIIVNMDHNIARHEVLHIGDNPIADFEGAKRFGFQALLINQNYTIDDIRKCL